MRQDLRREAGEGIKNVIAMKLPLAISILFILANIAFAQSSVSSLAPSHATALHKYLAANRDVHFQPETAIEKKTLKEMRSYFGKSFRPYYIAGDFNRDRRTDFAVILSRGRMATFDTPEETEARKGDLELRVVVFNGKRGGGFEAAFAEDVEAPETCMVLMDGSLYFGVYESDADTFSIEWKNGQYEAVGKAR